MSEILEVNSDFERLTESDLCSWIDDNYPLFYTEIGN